MNTTHRGQTLAMLSLTVLVITLMVLMTLSIGAKVRDRMDLQTVADAAAYSDAVATARTMNTMAVMNRAMIAHTVSTIGTVSLISYATLYYNNTRVARDLFALQLAIVAIGAAFWCALCGPWCAACCARCRACIQSIFLVLPSVILMTIHRNRVRSRLNQDQQVYFNETLPRFNASSSLYTSATTMFQNDLKTKIQTDPGSFAASYLSQSKIGWAQANNVSAAALNDAELDRATIPNVDYSGQQPYQAGVLAMGTRGHPFVPERELDAWEWSWSLSLPWSLPNATYANDNSEGRGYVNAGRVSNPNNMPAHGHPGPAPGVAGIWAHDDGNRVHTLMIPQFIGALFTGFSASYYTCTIFGPVAIAVGIIGRRAPDAVVGPTVHNGVHSGLHSHPTRTFPAFYDFNPNSLRNADDLNGQPRTVSVVYKTPPPDTANPWDLNVGTFGRGGPSGAGFTTSFDMMNAPQRLTGGRQVVLGAGVTYYLRPDHHTEPPNMFAPYWHATLGRLTIDRPAAGNVSRGAYDAEVITMLNNTGQVEAATAYQRLTQAGFLGLE